MDRPSRALVGIALVVAATACFGALDTITKVVSTSGVSVAMALWVRFSVQVVATALTTLPTRGWSALHTEHPRFQLLRGLLLLSCSMLAYFSLRFLPVGEFTAIIMIGPLVITVMAVIVLKERVSALRWVLVVGAFVGTLIIIRPGGDSFTWAMLLPLALVACNAWFQVLTSKMARTEHPLTMHLYTGLVGSLVMGVALPFVWTALDASTWVLMLLMGLAATVGHWMLILAYGRAPAATLTPYLYAQIGFAMLGGYLIFAHVPDQWALIGIAMVGACGAAGAWLTVLERRIPVEPTET